VRILWFIVSLMNSSVEIKQIEKIQSLRNLHDNMPSTHDCGESIVWEWVKYIHSQMKSESYSNIYFRNSQTICLFSLLMQLSINASRHCSSYIEIFLQWSQNILNESVKCANQQSKQRKLLILFPKIVYYSVNKLDL
jgi:hypothetical protein